MSILTRLRESTHDSARDDIVGGQYAQVDDAAGYVAAHQGRGPYARYFQSRLYLVREALRACPGGRILDVGCGPGMLVRDLLDRRPGDFLITACDRSVAMIDTLARQVGDSREVEPAVARIEDMPFTDESFDAVVAAGVLEYVDISRALHEIARVTRPDGLVLTTMLNPHSPYRLFEWGVYWPALRLLGRVEHRLHVPPDRRHNAPSSGIRAVPPGRLRRMMRNAGLEPQSVIHYDLTPLVPPVDRIVRRWTPDWPTRLDKTVGSGTRRWMGTAYLITARRQPSSPGGGSPTGGSRAGRAPWW
jgi:ubiquinone/menaquinone biosynthesis C-methylase UbiE